MAHTKLIFLNDHHLDDGGNENHGKSRRFQPKKTRCRATHAIVSAMDGNLDRQRRLIYTFSVRISAVKAS